MCDKGFGAGVGNNGVANGEFVAPADGEMVGESVGAVDGPSSAGIHKSANQRQVASERDISMSICVITRILHRSTLLAKYASLYWTGQKLLSVT